MANEQANPDSTAVRVALWRALHAEIDPPPHVLKDVVGLALAAPDQDWRERPDMHSGFTRPFRASIVARARFIEDLIEDAAGIEQYVILGAGLDSFAQRKQVPNLKVFEVDRPGPQAWKRRRLTELGYSIPDSLRFVPVDFETGEDWWRKLSGEGFDARKSAVVSCCGVSMYLTKGSVMAMLRQVATLAPGSSFVMSFLLPVEMADPELRPGLEAAIKGARTSGTPFLSFFAPPEILELARGAGFKDAQHVTAAELTRRYFAGRRDGLRPPSNAEELLLART